MHFRSQARGDFHLRNCPQVMSASIAPVLCALIAQIGGPSETSVDIKETGKAAVAAPVTAPGERTETKVVSKEIPAPVVYQFSRSVGPGRLVKAAKGSPGFVKRTYRVTFRNEKPVGKILLKEERKEPEPARFLMGRDGYRPSRGSFRRGRVMTMSATGYDPSPATIGPGATGRTASGRWATYGCVAVDPRVIRMGTLLYVEGYGFAIAADKGSAIKGRKIDLCFNSRSQALRFGRRKVRVHILRGR